MWPREHLFPAVEALLPETTFAPGVRVKVHAMSASSSVFPALADGPVQQEDIVWATVGLLLPSKLVWFSIWLIFGTL